MIFVVFFFYYYYYICSSVTNDEMRTFLEPTDFWLVSHALKLVKLAHNLMEFSYLR